MFSYTKENFKHIIGIHETTKKDLSERNYKKYTKIEVFSLIHRQYLSELLSAIEKSNFNVAKLTRNELPFIRQISIYKKQKSDFDQILCRSIQYNSKSYLLKIYGFKDSLLFPYGGEQSLKNPDGSISICNGEDFVKIEISVMSNRTKGMILNPEKEVAKNIPRIFDKIFKDQEIKFLDIHWHKAYFRTTLNFLRDIKRNKNTKNEFLKKKKLKTNTKKIKILQNINNNLLKFLGVSFLLNRVINKNIYDKICNTVYSKKIHKKNLYKESFVYNSFSRLEDFFLKEYNYNQIDLPP